jgi:hypothetical protein
MKIDRRKMIGSSVAIGLTALCGSKTEAAPVTPFGTESFDYPVEIDPRGGKGMNWTKHIFATGGRLTLKIESGRLLLVFERDIAGVPYHNGIVLKEPSELISRGSDFALSYLLALRRKRREHCFKDSLDINQRIEFLCRAEDKRGKLK